MELPTPYQPHSPQHQAKEGASLVRLSIFWRIVLTSLLIIVVMTAVNFYALFQLRQLSALSTNMAAHHYPAIEAGKRLVTLSYQQLNSEKKFLAVRDAAFLKHFDEEVEEFRRSIETMIGQEVSPDGRQLLEHAQRLQQERLGMFHVELDQAVPASVGVSPDYERRRDLVMDQMTTTLQHYVDFHESGISAGVKSSRESSAQAEAVTEQLVLLALLVG